MLGGYTYKQKYTSKIKWINKILRRLYGTIKISDDKVYVVNDILIMNKMTYDKIINMDDIISLANKVKEYNGGEINNDN